MIEQLKNFYSANPELVVLLAAAAAFILMVTAILAVIFRKRLKELYLKHKELILYVIMGGLATVINIVVFIVAAWFTHELVATTIAWAAAVAFAFFTNKFLVFESKSTERGRFLFELGTFVAARLGSQCIDWGMIAVFVTVLKYDKILIKIIANIIVVIVNYIISKLFIFKKDKNNLDEA